MRKLPPKQRERNIYNNQCGEKREIRLGSFKSPLMMYVSVIITSTVHHLSI
jgi:hypothetical protein